MISKAEKLHLKALISDTIVVLCKNGLASKIKGEFSIEGLIGISTEKDDLVLVNINEKLPSSECSTLEVTKKQPILKKRKRLSKKKVQENLADKVALFNEDTQSTNNSGSLQEPLISNQSTDVTNVSEFNISSGLPANTSTQRSRRYNSKKSSTISQTVGSLQQKTNSSRTIVSDSNDSDGVLTKRSKKSKKISNEEKIGMVDILANVNSKQYKKSNNAISLGEAYVHIEPLNGTFTENAREVSKGSVEMHGNLPGQSVLVSHINICPENEKNYSSDTTMVYVPSSAASEAVCEADAVSDTLSTCTGEKSEISMKVEDTNDPKTTAIAEYNTVFVKPEHSFQEQSQGVYPVLMIPVDQNVTTVSACPSQEFATNVDNYLDAEENEQKVEFAILPVTEISTQSILDINVVKKPINAERRAKHAEYSKRWRENIKLNKEKWLKYREKELLRKREYSKLPKTPKQKLQARVRAKRYREKNKLKLQGKKLSKLESEEEIQKKSSKLDLESEEQIQKKKKYFRLKKLQGKKLSNLDSEEIQKKLSKLESEEEIQKKREYFRMKKRESRQRIKEKKKKKFQ